MIKDFAICFSGQPRCIYSAKEDFDKLFKGTDFDVFGHVWNSDELLSSWGHNMGWENKSTNIHTAKEFVDLYQPKNVIIEDYKETEFYKNTISSLGYRNPNNKVWSSYSQFYSIKKSFESKKQYETENNISYKYTIKYRMDLDVDFDFSNLSTSDLIDKEWESIKKRIDDNPNIFITNPGYDWPNGNGVSNLLAIGNSETMYKYSKVFDFYPQLLKSCQYPDFDEANLKHYIQNICGIDLGICNINVGVYR